MFKIDYNRLNREGDKVDYKIMAIMIFFIILVSIQYTINKIVVLLKEIKDILYKINIRQ